MTDPSGNDRGPSPARGWWGRGLWLAERLGPVASAGSSAAGADAARPDADLAAWRHAHPDLTPDLLPLVAQGLGVSVDIIGTVLAADPAALAARLPKPAWAQTAESIVESVPDTPAAPVPGADWRAGFTAVVEPFVGYAVSRLRDARPFREAAGIVDAAQLLAVVRAQVTTRLVALVARTLVLELHVLRESGRLAGDDGEQRFRSFVEAFRTRAAVAAFVDEYAPLARAVVTAAGQAADTVAEFLERLADDRATLVAALFDGTDPGPVTDVHLGAGDPHDGGRAVILLRFASGRRLVYKPRPMAVHAHFNDVLEWFGERAPAAATRRLRVVDRGPYGWVEFAAAAPCPDTAAAERYFFRFGAQLALLHALAGTDFHYENIIAAGEHPTVVDVESLFHVGLPIVQGGFADADPATDALRASVAGVGLLPSVISGPAGGAVDIGGLGGDAGVLAPFESVGWEAPGTDRMRLIRVRRPSRTGQNKVVIDGEPAEPGTYAAQIRAGFALGYQTIVRHRDELTGPDGLLARFADDDTRVIVRATRVYSRLLDETSHPDVMRDALHRDRLLSVLWALVADDPARCALAVHELRDIWDVNVPLFRARAGSRDIRSTAGATPAGLLPESGLARAERIIGGMGDEDLARQDWIIRASLATREQVRQRKALPPQTAQTGRAARISRSSRAIRTEQPSTGDAAEPRRRALSAARLIAAQLEESAIRSGSRVSWFGLDMAADEQWLVSALKGDLFNGYSGVGLFFAQLAQVTGEQRYADLAEQTLLPLVTHVEQVIARGTGRARLGAFSGDCGLAYALASASALLDDPRLSEPVADLLALATSSVTTDTTFDLLGGAAGCLAVAEALVSRFKTAADLAAASASVLVDAAQPREAGVAWPSPLPQSQPLLGFSHGAAGIGWALLRHAARADDPKSRATGLAAFTYERTEFRPEVDNWPDFRLGDSRPWTQRPRTAGIAHMHTWCHGAPGIGLSRAALPSPARTPETEADLRRALASTTAFGRYGNHSLCHGELGNLELYAAAASSAGPEARAEYERRVVTVLDELAAQGPLCGTPGSLPTPGLMTGLAGIGHGLLRIAAPERVAPVLLLAEV